MIDSCYPIMRDGIDLIAAYGDEDKNVSLTAPIGGGGGGYFLMIDNYYCGSLFKRNDKWVFHSPSDFDLTTDDICILGDLIDEHNG